MSDEQCGADPFENGYDQKLSEKEYRERIKYLMRCHDDSADEIERLRTREARLREALQWYVDNDETNEVDPENAFWIAGRDRARAALEEEKK